MGNLGSVGIAFIVLNVALTWFTFRDQRWFERLLFEIAPVREGQWYRLLTSGFLHVSWNHLFFNMITLYFFAGVVERALDPLSFGIVYLVSLLGGNLLALVFQRGNARYRAVGASGAVSGIVYAAIALHPGMELAFIFVPIPFPAWIYGIGFILYSLYGMGRQSDNIGHEAHLGGAISGLLITIILQPAVALQNPMTIIYILVPAVVVLVVMLIKPRLLQMGVGNKTTNQGPDDRFREIRAQRQAELDRILDKIRTQGRDSLTQEEVRFLEENA